MNRLVCLISIVIFGFAVVVPVRAEILFDVYVGKSAAAVFQTEVYDIPITIGPKSVAVDRCIDGIRIWYTRGNGIEEDVQHPSILALKAIVQKYYGAKFKIFVGSANCPEDPDVNQIRFINTAKLGDVAFYNAVERALNELGIGKVRAVKR